MTPTPGSYRRRRIVERIMFTAAGVATATSVGVLLFLLGYIAVHGVAALSLSFFTSLPAPVGEPGGGMANAIVGSAKILFVAALVEIGLVLFVITLLVNAVARLLIATVQAAPKRARA